MGIKLSTLFLMALASVPALAHVPYIERTDFTWVKPFQITGNIEQSKAIYAWLQSGSDIDYYTFELTQPANLFLEVIVPVCPAYADFLPSYAIIGPGLPQPTEPLPVPLPQGYGAIVVSNLKPGQPRTTFYEPFGGKSYYDGVRFDQTISTPGSYAVIVWDPYGKGGDYVITPGKEEIWTSEDILRALVNTPYIRDNKELHTSCSN